MAFVQEIVGKKTPEKISFGNTSAFLYKYSDELSTSNDRPLQLCYVPLTSTTCLINRSPVCLHQQAFVQVNYQHKTESTTVQTLVAQHPSSLQHGPHRANPRWRTPAVNTPPANPLGDDLSDPRTVELYPRSNLMSHMHSI